MFNTYLTSLNINEVLKVLDTIGLLDFFFFPIRVNQVLDAKKKYLNRYDSNIEVNTNKYVFPIFYCNEELHLKQFNKI